MADLVIRGMEMPKEPTPLTLYPDGHWNDYTDGSNGKFVPLPSEHGRLIDADAFCKQIANDRRIGGIVAAGMISYIEHAPTIVPAEGGGEV